LRVAEVKERERIEQELRVARQIQRSLLPEATPELYGWQFATYYKPAREVGGDFYDFLELEDGRLGLVVGNATPISAENRASAGVAAGDEVEVDIELDTAPREVTVPPDLAEALERDVVAKRYFDG
jgi:hypothetical protein